MQSSLKKALPLPDAFEDALNEVSYIDEMSSGDADAARCKAWSLARNAGLEDAANVCDADGRIDLARAIRALKLEDNQSRLRIG